MRIILFTGKGGVGKTSVSAATGLAASNRGHKTLLISTDRAHSLADALARPLAATPVQVNERLWAQEIDPQKEMEEHWGEVKDHLQVVFSRQGLNSLVAEEMAVFPGMDDLFSLLLIKDRVTADDFDLLLVDCAPTGATLRLLSLPDVLGWYMRKLFHVERVTVGAIKPVADRLLPMPLPGDEVFAAFERLYQRVDGIKDILCDPDVTSVRLVTNPERMALEETRRAYTQFAVYALPVECVILNRVIPPEIEEPYFAALIASQQRYVRETHDCFAPLPILTLPLFPDETVGPEALTTMAERLYGDRDPAAVFSRRQPVRIEPTASGYHLIADLKFGTKGDFRLTRRGDELVIDVGSVRRNLLLPRALARLETRRAQFEDGILTIEFGGEQP